MWFSDIPFSVPTESADNSLAVTIRSASSMYQFLRRQVLDMLLTKLHVNLLLRVHNINLGLFKFVHQSKVDLLISIEMRTSNELMLRASNHTAPPSLQTLPAEIRFKIFEHLTEGTSMRVVGYRHGGRDAFWFKDRGKLRTPIPIVLVLQLRRALHFSRLVVYIRTHTETSFRLSAYYCDMQAVLWGNDGRVFQKCPSQHQVGHAKQLQW